MSRFVRNLNKTISIAYGEASGLGNFLQVFDLRTENKLYEGYVYDYDDFLGAYVNYINLEAKDVHPEDIIIQKCDEFYNSDKFKNMPELEKV